MHIIIPMSGQGQRFKNAGYKTLKPLIEIDGKPIIEHVVNLFPGETKFSFICNEQHLKETNMKEILERIAPEGNIIPIKPHKLGPIYAVSQIYDQIDDSEEVIVNYCDFGTYWDYKDFLNHTRTRNADGAIPSYKGFHPHMLGTTNYAFMRDQDQWMLEIQEKKPFTDNRMNEYASNGTYYFRTGKILKDAFDVTLEKENHVNGEYYVSVVFNELIKKDLKVSIYDIQHMLQWGTPEDVEEYNYWSNYFRDIVEKDHSFEVQYSKETVNLIPMAGLGSRFSKEGYTTPKPLIQVSGKPMVVQAAASLPMANKNVFVCLEDHLKSFPLEKTVNDYLENNQFVSLNHVTEGQACTTAIGIEAIDKDSSILIAACDNAMLYDKKRFQELVDDNSVDVIFWSFRNYPGANKNPQAYGWINVDGNLNINSASVKKAISDNPANDHAIVGAFYFRKANDFIKALELMQEKNIRVNNEFYVDSMANVLGDLGLKGKVFEIDYYTCWGTPNDYETYRYWQSFFSKCDWHPYSLEQDPIVNPDSIDDLTNQYEYPSQPNP